MKKITIAVMLLSAITAAAQKCQMYSSTDAHRWQKTNVSLTARKGNAPDEQIIVYTDSLLQEVDGFGGTFSERGWDAMQCLNESQRLSVMTELFGADGIHFAWGRTPVGGNDLALSTYTYNDV